MGATGNQGAFKSRARERKNTKFKAKHGAMTRTEWAKAKRQARKIK